MIFKRFTNTIICFIKFLIPVAAISFSSCGQIHNEVNLLRIEVSHLPNKLEYYINEEFDSTGLAVLSYYSNGKEEEIKDYSLSTIDMSKSGEKEVVVSYQSLTTSFYIEVKPYEPVYLIMGQSNASGNSLWKYLETKDPSAYSKFSDKGTDNVLLSYDNYVKKGNGFLPTRFGMADDNHGENAAFGPEIGMADVFSSEKETTYLIKAAFSGSPLSLEWLTYEGERYWLYNHMIDFIISELSSLKEQGKNPTIKGLFWMQGESDSKAYDMSLLYKEHELLFFNYLQEDLGDYIHDEMMIVDAHISARCPLWTNYGIINQSKTELSSILSNHHYLTTNGEDGLLILNKDETGEEEGDSAHFESFSMLELGRKAARVFLDNK